MRPAVLAATLLLLPLGATLAAPALAQSEGAAATLVLDVQEDRSEAMSLTFDGLRRLTRYQDLCLPVGARETSVRDGLGEVPYDARDEDGRRVISFAARDETVTIAMTRPAPPANDRPLYRADVNFCVPTGARTRIEVAVPPDHALFYASYGARIEEGLRATVETEGPAHVFYAYEAPLAGSDVQAIDVPPFRVFAAPAQAVQAEEAARLAAGPLRAALEEAGLELPFDRLRVLYQRETPHAWEAGHYNGHGYVSVKEDTLDPDPAAGWPLKPVKVLVHEAFHAASYPGGSGPVEDALSWWLEGTARHSERHVDAALPNATIHCERSAVEVSCRSFDDRITRAQLDAAYEPGFSFDARWEPSASQSDETRAFYYAYSQYVVGAWIARRGVDHYRAVWDEVGAAFARGDGCPCGEGWLLGVLDDEDVFRPWADVRASEPERFEALVRPFVQDEAALRRELDAQAGPLGGLGVPLSAWSAPLALGAALLFLLRRRRA